MHAERNEKAATGARQYTVFLRVLIDGESYDDAAQNALEHMDDVPGEVYIEPDAEEKS